MKKILATCALLTSLSPALFANVECYPANAAYTENEGSLYSFEASASCSMSGQSVSTDTIVKQFRKALKRGGSISGELDGFTVDDMVGNEFTYRENRYDSGHGHISVTYNAYLVSDSGSVSYSADSTHIEADGNAARTKKVILNISYTLTDNGVDVSITKNVNIDKPFIAPEGLFISGAEQGLRESLDQIASVQSDVLNSL